MIDTNCDKHPSSPIDFFCETCKWSLCKECKAEHNKNHTMTSVEEVGQNMLNYLNKETDVTLYKQISTLNDQLKAKVTNIRNWFENIKEKVTDIIQDCTDAIMNEVVEQTNEKLEQKKEQLEKALDQLAIDRKKYQAELQDILDSKQYQSFAKYKTLYFQLLEKEHLFKSIACSKPMWKQHVRKLEAVTEDSLKQNVSNALKHVFNVPLLYIIPNRNNQIFTYDVANKKRNVHVLDNIRKSKHFDSALVRNCIYIVGGQDEESKELLRDTYEYEIIDNGILEQKDDMIKGRFGHRVVSVSESFIYSLGGIIKSFLGTKYTNHCEKYDRVYNRWVEVKPMYESKGYMSVCHFKGRFIYVFGGFSDDVCSESSSTVELFDTMIEGEGWSLLKFTNIGKKWAPISQAGVAQIGEQMILLFGGRTNKMNYTQNCYLFNIKDSTMKQLEAKIESPRIFYQRQVIAYKDHLYAFDANHNDLHKFDPEAIRWNMVKKEEWNTDNND